MTGKTHVAIGLGMTGSIMTTSGIRLEEMIVGLGLSVIGSLIVDCDIRGSKASRAIKDMLRILGILSGMILIAYVKTGVNLITPFIVVISKSISTGLGLVVLIIGLIIGRVTPHRSFTHSISGLVVFSVGVYLIVGNLTLWFIVGYTMHILADMLTYTEVKVLYPFIKHGVALHVCKSGGKLDCVLRYVGYSFCVLGILGNI